MSSFNEQPNLQPGQEPENAAAPAAGESVTPPVEPEVEKNLAAEPEILPEKAPTESAAPAEGETSAENETPAEKEPSAEGDANEPELQGSTIFTKSEPAEKPKKTISGKKRRRNIILILIAAAIVLGAGVFAAVKFLPNVNSESEETTTPSIKIKEVTATDLRKITVKTKNKTLVFNGTLTESSTASSGEAEKTVAWSLEGYDPTLIADSSINAVADSCSALYATRQMTDLSLDYGLNDPAVTVEVTLQNAAENYTISFGSLSPDGSGYYTKVSGVEGVYLVAAGTVEKVNTTPEKLANTVIVTAPSKDDAKSSESKYFGEDDTKLAGFDTITLSGSYYPNPITLTATSNKMAKYQITVGSKVRYANEENTTAMLGILADGLVAIDTYKLAPTKADITAYGLDAPDAVVTLKYAENSVTVRAKLYDKEKNYYAVTVDGRNAIYAVTAEALSMLDKREADLYNQYAFLEYLKDFSNIKINAGGKDYSFDIAYDEKEEKMTVTSNGAAVDDSLLSAYYQYLVTLSPTENNESCAATAAYTAQLKPRDGSKAFVIKLYKQSERRYMLEINGEKYGVISSSIYESLTNYVQYVMEGKGIPDAA